MSSVEVEMEDDSWDDDEPSVDGEPLPLARYAFITAALSEGYTLFDVLEREGLSEAEWEATEDHWVEALEESAETGLAVHDDLDRAMAAARARFARKVAPLDTDVAAFVAFQRHVLAAPRLLPFLSEYGLFFGDWVRLQEAWAERISADPETRAAAGRAFAEAEMPALPQIEAGPRVWPAAEPEGREGAAGWPEGVGAAGVEPAGAGPGGARPGGAGRGKRAVRIVEAAGEPAAEELEWGLAGIRGEIDPRIQELSAPVQAAGAGSPRAETAAPAPVQAAGARSPRAETAAPAPPVPSAPASPADASQLPSFMRRAMQEASEAIEKSARISAAAPLTDETFDSTEPKTLEAQPSPLKRVLPFEKGARSAAAAAPVAPAAAAAPAPPPAAAAPAPPPAAAAPAPPPAVPPKTGGLMETTLDARPSPLKGALPFQRPGAAAAAKAPPVAAARRPGALDDPPHSERTLDEDEATELAQRAAARGGLPFMPVPGPKGILVPPRESGAPHRAAPGSPSPSTSASSAIGGAAPVPPPGGANVPVPDLTLGQYASLCAELGAFPDATEEVFARYGLASVHVRMQVDLVWRERLRGDPALHERWQNLYDQAAARIKR